MLPLHARFVDKAEAALVAAIDVYNKPMFEYREADLKPALDANRPSMSKVN